MIFVTGASGFIGSGLCSELQRRGIVFTGLVSNESNICNWYGPENVQMSGRITPEMRLSDFPDGVRTVIHCVSQSVKSKKELWSIELKALERLIELCVKKNVERFIFLSSVKVLAETTQSDSPLTAESQPNPSSNYGRFKLVCEQLVKNFLSDKDMDWVIIRPPLVYGPNVKGNFRLLLTLARLQVPLPFRGITNSRSMVALDNLVDFIICCAERDQARNQIFLVSDGQDLSTRELLEKLVNYFGERPLLFPFPQEIIKLVCHLVGKAGIYQRLFENLVIDSEATQEIMSWTPSISVDEGLRRCVCYEKV